MAANLGLNRLTFSSFRALPLEMRDCMAHEWLATWGIAQRMRQELILEHLPVIPEEMTLERLKIRALYPIALNAAIEAGDAQAMAFADKLGVALAALIATLKLAPPDARAARADWTTANWDNWCAVQKIVLGGGLFSGALGLQMYASALKWLPEFGIEELQVILPDQPRLLMLKGLARAFESGTVIAIDAGHTAIKRGIAKVGNHNLLEFCANTLLEIPYLLSNPSEVLDYLVDALSELALKSGQPKQFGISISAHLDAEGNVLAGSSSFYAILLEFRLVQEFELRLAKRLGYACTVQIMHEGKAAANSLKDTDAAILLGTSVGGGFRA
jgi:predicted NBD/HSP70 family sugar kinase